MKEGVIKFNCTWIQSSSPDEILITEINKWRNKLFKAKLIGANDDGIGYGNISRRYRDDMFIISGSGTGSLPQLSPDQYTLVTGFNIEDNTVIAEGRVIASSESLTHAAIYNYDQHIHAVMHVHHTLLWKYLLKKFPSSDAFVEYGTPLMAKEIMRLFKEDDLASQKIFAMGGHEDGVIAFGKNPAEAGKILFEQLALSLL